MQKLIILVVTVFACSGLYGVGTNWRVVACNRFAGAVLQAAINAGTPPSIAAAAQGIVSWCYKRNAGAKSLRRPVAAKRD